MFFAYNTVCELSTIQHVKIFASKNFPFLNKNIKSKTKAVVWELSCEGLRLIPKNDIKTDGYIRWMSSNSGKVFSLGSPTLCELFPLFIEY